MIYFSKVRILLHTTKQIVLSFQKKATMDFVFVFLTGWVMDTLLSFVAFIVYEGLLN